MKRREFIVLLGSAGAAWPLAARAQVRGRMPRVGFLWHATNADEETPYFGAFRQGLTDIGYADGRNIEIIDTFAAEQMEAYDRHAAALINLRIDILVAN